MKESVHIRLGNPDEIRELRHKVLWPHLESSLVCNIPPDRDSTTFHVVAEQDHKIVGTATFIVDINTKFDEKNQYRLRAMATDSAVRGYGVGAQILTFGIHQLKDKKVKLLWCDARLIATGFYEKQKFKIKGQVYEVPQIGPHKLMYKVL